MTGQDGAEASRTKRGLRTLTRGLVRGPMDLTVGLSQGLHNVPRLYGDRTVREPHKITGYKSGLKAAGKDLGLGMYDGFAGLVVHPIQGARHGGGASGAAAGFARGWGGALFKPIAGVSGLFGYTFKGIHKELQKKGPKESRKLIHQARIEQGLEELADLDVDRRNIILQAWRSLSISS